MQDRVAAASTPGLRAELDTQSGAITPPWLEWLAHLAATLDKAPQRLSSVSLTAQAASIASTALKTGLTAGLYRVSYYARITTAAGTSSSLTVTFGWTDGAVTPSQSGAAITGNTTTTIQSGTLLIRVDANTAVNYSTTYASTPASAMQHSLDLFLEEMPT